MLAVIKLSCALGTLVAGAHVNAFGAAAAPQTWPQTCVSGPSYSYWNETHCPNDATCCPAHFSVSGMGCCPLKNAVCCSSYGQCCPSGTKCVPQSGTGYDEVFTCVANGVNVSDALSTCKPGPSLPFAPNLKNVLIVGDSVSIGYTPFVASVLKDIALVQHAPWDYSDGGAEETGEERTRS